MKVRECIEALQKLDPDAEVFCIDGSEEWSQLEGFEAFAARNEYEAVTIYKPSHIVSTHWQGYKTRW